MHGLAPHLDAVVPDSSIAASVPLATLDWLAEQAGLNARRIDRMHDELAAILAAAAAAGIEVMPLKGAILTTRPGVEPGRRPMADLDLLVRPADRAGLGALLAGARLRTRARERPTSDARRLRRSGWRPGRVTDGEHPDNPRRVEVHVEVKRHLWGWATTTT